MSTATSSPRSRWRFIRPRFSLRLLLVLFTAIALFLGYWCNGANEQRKAVAALRHCGVVVMYHGQPDHMRYPDADGPMQSWLSRQIENYLGIDYAEPVVTLHSVVAVHPVDATNLADTTPCLPSLRRLESIDIRGDASADDLAEVAKVSTLESLQLYSDERVPDLSSFRRHRQLSSISINNACDDSLMEHLPEIPGLAQLSVSGEGVTNRGVGFLKNCPRLERISLFTTAIGDEGLKALVDLPHLRELELWDNDLSDNCAPWLAQMESLETLSLESSELTSKSLPKLAKLKKLHTLQLSFNPIDDSEIESLLKAPALRRFAFTATKISDAGLLKLAEHPTLESLQFRISDSRIPPNAWRAYAPCILS